MAVLTAVFLQLSNGDFQQTVTDKVGAGIGAGGGHDDVRITKSQTLIFF